MKIKKFINYFFIYLSSLIVIDVAQRNYVIMTYLKCNRYSSFELIRDLKLLPL